MPTNFIAFLFLDFWGGLHWTIRFRFSRALILVISNESRNLPKIKCAQKFDVLVIGSGQAFTGDNVTM